jgi:hypothetical protein
MKLKTYHNPKNIDESLVPEGWRMLYAEEFPLPRGHKIPCRLFTNKTTLGYSHRFLGVEHSHTYIIPVKA